MQSEIWHRPLRNKLIMREERETGAPGTRSSTQAWCFAEVRRLRSAIASADRRPCVHRALRRRSRPSRGLRSTRSTTVHSAASISVRLRADDKPGKTAQEARSALN
jgi:hypothetical protein